MSRASRFIKKPPAFLECGDLILTGLNTSGTVGNISKEHQASEFLLDFSVSQAFTVLPTAANIDELFKRVVFELNSKDICNISSRGLSVVSSLYESAITYQLSTSGTVATFSGTLDVHAEMDGLLEDMITAINTPSTMSVNVTTGDNTVWTNGTPVVGSAPAYTIKLRAKDYGTENKYDEQGAFYHSLTEKTTDTTSAVSGTRTVQLNGMCLTRAIIFNVGTVVGTVFTPSDALIGNIRYTINGKTTITTFAALKNILQRMTGFNKAGISGVVFGDTVSELAQSESESITISYDIVNPAGATVKVGFYHDAMRPF